MPDTPSPGVECNLSGLDRRPRIGMEIYRAINSAALKNTRRIRRSAITAVAVHAANAVKLPPRRIAKYEQSGLLRGCKIREVKLTRRAPDNATFPFSYVLQVAFRLLSREKARTNAIPRSSLKNYHRDLSREPWASCFSSIPHFSLVRISNLCQVRGTWLRGKLNLLYFVYFFSFFTSLIVWVIGNCIYYIGL